MPKPIAQRGFEVSRGDFSSNSYYLRYFIDQTGLERIWVKRGIGTGISICLDEGEIESISVETPQLSEQIYLKRSEGQSPQNESEKKNLEQALNVYREVKKILNVDEGIKDYCPRFSHKSEINVYNVLSIDDASQIEALLKKED